MMAPIEFDRFRTDYLSVLAGPRYAVTTRKKMEQILSQVEDLGVHSTAELTTVIAARYAQERIQRVCANTVRGELGYLRAACNFAVEEGWLDRAPRWRRLWPRRSPRRRKTLHSIEDIGKSLSYLNDQAVEWTGHRLYAAAALVAHTGLRKSEALHAWQADLHLPERLFVVSSRRRLKTEASERLVPLAPAVVPILRDWMWRARSRYLFPHRGRTGPWISGGRRGKPTVMLRAAGLAVGVEGLTFQSLRHSWATWARRRWGLSAVDVRDILGHTDVSTHELHYLHGVPDELAASVRAISFR